MPVLEHLRGSLRLRARGDARSCPYPNPEVPTSPQFSSAFVDQQRKQQERDERMGALIVTEAPTKVGFGQDREVSLLVTTEGTYVAKTLKDTSRPHMVFGLGISPAEIPCDTDTSGRRQQMVDERRHQEVDPEQVAEKLRLSHIFARTHLDRGDKLIVPTATVVFDAQVQDRQPFIPQIQLPAGVIKDPLEVRLEAQAKTQLFRTLQSRWQEALRTPDFKQLPPDVQDYWRSYPPDSGYGTNARFLGLGNVVAIDY